MYVTLFPCNECAKAIIQAGIKRLVYDSDKYNGTPSTIASRKMLSAAGVDIQKYEHTGRTVTIQLAVGGAARDGEPFLVSVTRISIYFKTVFYIG